MRGVYCTFQEVTKSKKVAGVSLPAGSIMVYLWRGPVGTQVPVINYIANAEGEPLLATDDVTAEMVACAKSAISMLDSLGTVKPKK